MANCNPLELADHIERCDWCGDLYDTYCNGHHDEATGLRFCDAPCESNYDRETGLPPEYVRPPE